MGMANARGMLMGKVSVGFEIGASSAQVQRVLRFPLLVYP